MSQSAQHRGTALFRTLIGDDHVWGLTEQLLATVVDILQVGNWQFAAANSKKKPKKPKPIRRPGVGQARTIERGTAVPLSEARKMFEAHNPAVFASTVWQPPTVSERRCTVGGCDGKHHAKGLCNRHYQQQRRRSA